MGKEGEMLCRNKRYVMAVATVTVGLLLLGAMGFGQGSSKSPGAGPQFRLLLIDETKTFASTMRVGALAGIIKKTGMFDLTVKLVDVDSSFDDPLAGQQTGDAGSPYQVILILPKGLDDGTIGQIWLVTRPFGELSPPLIAAIEVPSYIVDQAFRGVCKAVDVTEDLLPGFFAAWYMQKGWLE